MSRYFLCKVIGDGTPENRARPSIIDSFPDKVWSAIYHPAHFPHKVCVVRIDLEKGAPVAKGSYIRELKSERNWKTVRKNYGVEQKHLKPEIK